MKTIFLIWKMQLDKLQKSLMKQDQRSTAQTRYQLGPLSYLGHFGSHLGPSGNYLGPFGNDLGPFGRHLLHLVVILVDSDRQSKFLSE